MEVLFVTASFFSSIVSQGQPLCLGNNQKSQGPRSWTIERLRNSLDANLGQIVCDKDEVVDWCIDLVEMHWLDLKSAGLFLGISYWTPLKPQHINPNPLANQLLCIDFLTPSTPLIIPSQTPCLLESLIPTQKLMLDSCKIVKKQPEAVHRFLWRHFFQV